MDNNINKYFDFVLFEIEADCIEEEIEEIKSIIAKSSGYYGRQRNNVLEKATPIINKLQRAAARSRAEANKRKEQWSFLKNYLWNIYVIRKLISYQVDKNRELPSQEL